MGTVRTRVATGLILGAVTIAGIAAPASAVPVDVLAGHGNFEKPVITGTSKVFPVGATFDGWKVSVGKVSLIASLPGTMTPPLGKQALMLVDTSTSSVALLPGSVCRSLPSIKSHRYTVAFKAATIGGVQVVVKLGTATKTVSLPTQTVRPVTFKQYQMTLTAPATNAQFCLTSAKTGFATYPAIDALKVTDLGL